MNATQLIIGTEIGPPKMAEGPWKLELWPEHTCRIDRVSIAGPAGIVVRQLTVWSPERKPSAQLLAADGMIPVRWFEDRQVGPVVLELGSHINCELERSPGAVHSLGEPISFAAFGLMPPLQMDRPPHQPGQWVLVGEDPSPVLAKVVRPHPEGYVVQLAGGVERVVPPNVQPAFEVDVVEGPAAGIRGYVISHKPWSSGFRTVPIAVKSNLEDVRHVDPDHLVLVV